MVSKFTRGPTNYTPLKYSVVDGKSNFHSFIHSSSSSGAKCLSSNGVVFVFSPCRFRSSHSHQRLLSQKTSLSNSTHLAFQKSPVRNPIPSPNFTASSSSYFFLSDLNFFEKKKHFFIVVCYLLLFRTTWSYKLVYWGFCLFGDG